MVNCQHLLYFIFIHPSNRSDSYAPDVRSRRRLDNDNQLLGDERAEPRAHATHSATYTGATTQGSLERRPVTPSVMADLELEPVSPDDDSLDKLFEEGEEEKEEDCAADQKEEGGSRKVRKEDAGSKDDGKSASSDGQEEEGEDGDRRRKNRVPIEMVDFGEAARHTRSTVGPSGAPGGGAAAVTPPAAWSNWRPEGRGGYSAQPAPIPPPPPQSQRLVQRE